MLRQSLSYHNYTVHIVRLHQCSPNRLVLCYLYPLRSREFNLVVSPPPRHCVLWSVDAIWFSGPIGHQFCESCASTTFSIFKYVFRELCHFQLKIYRYFVYLTIYFYSEQLLCIVPFIFFTVAEFKIANQAVVNSSSCQLESTYHFLLKFFRYHTSC